MKKTVFILAILLSKVAGAQFFLHQYGNNPEPERCEQAVPVSGGSMGCMMAGVQFSNNKLRVHVVHPDNNGNVGGAYFNQVYTLTTSPLSHNPQYTYNATGTSVAEINRGGGVYEYAVVGTLDNMSTPQKDIFVMRLSATGTVLALHLYSIGSAASITTYTVSFQPKAKIGGRNQDILITGGCRDFTNNAAPQNVFIMSINSTNDIPNWVKVYDMTVNNVSQNDIGLDIIENPVNTNQVLVVGTSGTDGLFLRVDALGMGAVINARRYNFAASQMLRAIHSVTTTYPINVPFLVTGHANVGTPPTLNTDVWTMLINEDGTIGRSTNHDSRLGPINNIGFDGIGRPAVGAGTPTYYTVGDLTSGPPSFDIQVLKLNNTLMTTGEYIYGNATNMEMGRSIFLSSVAGGGGITFAGSSNNPTPPGNQDQLLGAAYMNGFTACQYDLGNFTSSVNIPTDVAPNVGIDDGYMMEDLDYSITYPANTVVCEASSVMNGSNAKSVPVDQPKNGFGFSIRENGSGQAIAIGVIEVDVVNNQSDKLEVQIIDMLGRKIECALDYDANDLKNGHIRIKAPALQHGNYYVVLTDGVNQKTQTLIVR